MLVRVVDVDPQLWPLYPVRFVFYTGVSRYNEEFSRSVTVVKDD